MFMKVMKVDNISISIIYRFLFNIIICHSINKAHKKKLNVERRFYLEVPLKREQELPKIWK